MLRHALLIAIAPFSILSCATPRTFDLRHEDALDDLASAPRAEIRAEAAGELDLSRRELEAEPVAAAPVAALHPVPQDEQSLHASRFTLKGGYYGATEDALDDGYIFGVSWMRFISRIFALELEVGYLDVDGSDSGTDLDVWAAPLMVNGRFNLPLWILDLYAGAGVGTFYYDAEASGVLSGSDDGFLWATNAFLGATINLADRIALGLEGKYYLTDDVDDVDEGLDAYALMLTLGFSR